MVQGQLLANFHDAVCNPYMITKILFQTSPQKPPAYVVEKLLGFLEPGWIYFHFTDDEVINFFRNNPIEGLENIVDRFHAMPAGANKADLFRYYFLYLKGGVFLDSDAMLNAPIIEIVKDYSFFSVDSYARVGTLFQGLIGCAPGHPAIKRALHIGYDTDPNVIKNDYYFLCHKHQFFTDKQDLSSVKLYPECFYDEDMCTVLSDEGKVLALHYWRYKVIPIGSKKIIPKDSIRKKNLVYVTVHGKEDYADLFNLFFTSLLLHTKQAWNFTFLIQTSQKFLKKIEYLKYFPLDIQIWLVADKTAIFDATTARYEIFNFVGIERYQKILYLDIDILIGDHLNILFDQPLLADKLYCLPEGLVSSPQDYYGKSIFELHNRQDLTSEFGFSSGVLLFKNTKRVQQLFNDVRTHSALDYFQKKSNHFYDQPYLNFYAITRGMQELELMQTFLKNNPASCESGFCIYHFSGIPGSFDTKIKKMSAFLMLLFKDTAISDVSWLAAIATLTKSQVVKAGESHLKRVSENLSVVMNDSFKGFCVSQPYSDDALLIAYPECQVTYCKTLIPDQSILQHHESKENTYFYSKVSTSNEQVPDRLSELSDQSLIELVVGRRPELHDYLIELKRKKISDLVSLHHGSTVAYGPFKGLQLSELSHWGGADRGTMVLGLYEQELLGILSALAPRRETLIDLGAGDGYYGVGALVGGLFKQSYCFEMSAKGREIIIQNAKLNYVEERVHILGEATRTFYEELPAYTHKDSVLLVDIEGAEFDLFDQSTFTVFSSSLIIIEIHLWMPDIHNKIQKLINDARATHQVEKVMMSTRDLSGFPELNALNDNSRWLLCSEGRAHLMYWLKFEPRMPVA